MLFRAARLVVAAVMGLGVAPVSQAAEKVGVILFHGKQGSPEQMSGLAQALQAAGYLAEAPEMCWSRNRIYDRLYLECIGEADGAAARLRSRGATAIAIVAQSTGSNAALGYAARRSGLKAVAVMAPASNPRRMRQYPTVANSIKKANELIAAGKGDVRTTMGDNNNGQDITVQATPKVYLSWYGPDSAGDFPSNLARIKVPILWIMSAGDPGRTGVPEAKQRQGFAVAKNPKNRFMTISAGHFSMPDASRDTVVSWLKGLDGR